MPLAATLLRLCRRKRNPQMVTPLQQTHQRKLPPKMIWPLSLRLRRALAKAHLLLKTQLKALQPKALWKKMLLQSHQRQWTLQREKRRGRKRLQKSLQ